MKTNQYLGRGIHKEKFKESLKSGNLSKMLEVINNDKDLDVQIRSDYLNIYYKGGNIAKVKSENSVEFDAFYFYLFMKERAKKYLTKVEIDNLKLKRNELTKKFKANKYEDYFASAKVIMDEWFKLNPNPERLDQQLLSIENKYNKSDYTIIDLEYQVSIRSDFRCTYLPDGKKEPKKPRFDIIAVNKQGTLCVIELKKGIGALKNTSGLKEHWECYRDSIGQNHEQFMKEMKNLLKQKQDFNLIDKNVKIVFPTPEFMFAYSYDDKSSIEKQDEIFLEEYNKIGLQIHFIKLMKETHKLLD